MHLCYFCSHRYLRVVGCFFVVSAVFTWWNVIVDGCALAVCVWLIFQLKLLVAFVDIPAPNDITSGRRVWIQAWLSLSGKNQQSFIHFNSWKWSQHYQGACSESQFERSWCNFEIALYVKAIGCCIFLCSSPAMLQSHFWKYNML